MLVWKKTLSILLLITALVVSSCASTSKQRFLASTLSQKDQVLEEVQASNLTTILLLAKTDTKFKKDLMETLDKEEEQLKLYINDIREKKMLHLMSYTAVGAAGIGLSAVIATLIKSRTTGQSAKIASVSSTFSYLTAGALAGTASSLGSTHSLESLNSIFGASENEQDAKKEELRQRAQDDLDNQVQKFVNIVHNIFYLSVAEQKGLQENIETYLAKQFNKMANKQKVDDISILDLMIEQKMRSSDAQLLKELLSKIERIENLDLNNDEVTLEELVESLKRLNQELKTSLYQVSSSELESYYESILEENDLIIALADYYLKEQGQKK